MKRNCMECDLPISGREDKKFCCDGCRNAFNNRMNRDSTNMMRNVNNKLRKNYRILNELNAQGRSTITHEKLLHKGFELEYITHILTTKTGKTYRFVYNQGYILTDDNQLILVKRDS